MSKEPREISEDDIRELISFLYMTGKIYLHQADEAFIAGDKVRAQAYEDCAKNFETAWRMVADDEDFGPVEPDNEKG